MGFSDLLTSSRGPGVIGTLLALLVLVGFGTLYIFVFDEGLQGGKPTIQSVLRTQTQEIQSLKDDIIRANAAIAEGEITKEQGKEKSKLETTNTLNAERIKSTTADREELMAAIEAAKAKWEEYKDAYRASEWAAAEGESLGDLKTLSGRSYTKVIITKVSHIGVEITDETGKRRIDGADLPLELQDRFQFDEEDKTAETKKEDDTFKDLSSNVEVANLAKKGQEKLLRVSTLKAEIEKANGGIEDCKANEPGLLRRADSINAEIAAEAAKSADRAGRGARGINRTPQLRESLRVAERNISDNRNKIRDYEKQIVNSKREISTLESEVSSIKTEIAKLKKELAAKQQEQQPAAAGSDHN